MPKNDSKHENFSARVNCFRLTESDESDKVIRWQADVIVFCQKCKRRFKFIGLPAGASVMQPMVNVDGTELRAPIEPTDILQLNEPPNPLHTFGIVFLLQA